VAALDSDIVVLVTLAISLVVASATGEPMVTTILARCSNDQRMFCLPLTCSEGIESEKRRLRGVIHFSYERAVEDLRSLSREEQDRAAEALLAFLAGRRMIFG